MGDFNVSCGVSGLSISGDAAVLIPLLPARHTEDVLTQAWVCSNDACALFVPLALPLFGEHDSYGRLAHIEAGPATALLEAHYHTSIQTFMRSLCTPHAGERLPQLPRGATGMYVHRAIWEMMRRPLLNEWGAARDRHIDQQTLDWYHMSLLRDHTWKACYGPVRQEPWYIAAVTALLECVSNLSAVNRLLMPSYNGYQYGNHHAHRQVLQKALEVLEANMHADAASEPPDAPQPGVGCGVSTVYQESVN